MARQIKRGNFLANVDQGVHERERGHMRQVADRSQDLVVQMRVHRQHH